MVLMRFLLLLLLINPLGCWRQGTSPRIANDAQGQSAVYRIVYAGAEGQGSGTAWAISRHLVITAGHVCEHSASTFVLQQQDERYPVVPVAWEYGDGGHDLCLLHSPVALGHTLELADQMPEVGESVSYEGYPNGEWAEHSGVYLGDLDGEEVYNDYAFSTWCARGASGSAVTVNGRVWGVLVRVRVDGGYIHDGSDGCVAVPLSHIRGLLKRALP